MTRGRSWRALARDRRGVTIVEFAIVLVPLLVGIMGLLELGYSSYVKALLQGALQVAARDATIANKTPAEIQTDVYQALGPLVKPQYVNTTIRSYYNFSRIGKPEKLTDDKNGNGSYDSGDCYEDANDNGAYDNGVASGRGTGGNADEVVAYTISVNYPRILPTSRLIGFSANEQLTGTTMLRNQPFAKDVVIRTLCN